MTTPLRLVHVAGSAQWAGGEVFLQQMAERLNRNRFAMHVVCPEEGPLLAEIQKRGIPCEMVRVGPLGDPRPIKNLAAQFKKWNADIVQSHGARSNFYTRLAAGNIPCISTVHNALTDYPISPFKKLLYVWMDALTAPKADVIVCVAEALKQELAARNPKMADRVRVIHNGVDRNRFDPARINRDAVRQQLGLAGDWTLGVVGRMTDQKGHRYLLEALQQIQAQLPPMQVLFVGDGPLRDMLQKKTEESHLEKKIKFLGVRRDIPEILAALDLLVLPSVSEGFPYTLLEALAMKCPVLASDVNGVSEIVGNNEFGWKTPSRNSEILGKILLAISKNPEEARTKAEAGFQRVGKEFDVNVTLKKWESLYEEMARRPRPKGKS